MARRSDLAVRFSFSRRLETMSAAIERKLTPYPTRGDATALQT